MRSRLITVLTVTGVCGGCTSVLALQPAHEDVSWLDASTSDGASDAAEDFVPSQGASPDASDGAQDVVVSLDGKDGDEDRELSQADADADGSSILVLASGLNSATTLAVDDRYLFYTTGDNDGIWKVPISGATTPTRLLSLSGVLVVQVAAAGSTVYFSVNSNLFAIDDSTESGILGDSGVTPIISDSVNAFALTGTGLVYWDYSCNLNSAAEDGSNVVTIYTGKPTCLQGPVDLVAGSSSVAGSYQTTISSVQNSIVVAGPIAPQGPAVFLDFVGAYDVDTVMGLSNGYVYYYSWPPNEGITLYRQTSVGAQAQTVPCSMGLGGPIAFDNDSIYCANEATVARQPLDLSHSPTDFYSGTNVTSVIADANFVYVADALSSGSTQIVRVTSH